MSHPHEGAPEELLEALARVARDAGAAILGHYDQPVEVEYKQDRSPVTAADRAAERIIASALRARWPEIPVIAEEEVASGLSIRAGGGRFWLVDPLDGTKEFISRNGEFTVNIALVERGQPALGVVFAPALDLLFAGAGSGCAYAEERGARQPIRCRVPGSELTVVSSRSHGDEAALLAFLDGCPVAGRRTAGSSLKFCEVARGRADVYPRLGRTMEWDTAAGHAVLRAAGGEVWSLRDQRPLVYGKAGFANPHFVAAALPPPAALRARHGLAG